MVSDNFLYVICSREKDSRKKKYARACVRACRGEKKEKANWLLACACRKVYGYGWDLPC